jgi:hypothetical protein
MTVDISALIAVFGFALSVGTFFVGRLTAAKTDGLADGELKSDIKHIKATQTEMKEDIKTYGMNYTELKTELASIKGRVAKLEEVIKIYHEGGL